MQVVVVRITSSRANGFYGNCCCSPVVWLHSDRTGVSVVCQEGGSNRCGQQISRADRDKPRPEATPVSKCFRCMAYNCPSTTDAICYLPQSNVTIFHPTFRRTEHYPCRTVPRSCVRPKIMRWTPRPSVCYLPCILHASLQLPVHVGALAEVTPERGLSTGASFTWVSATAKSARMKRHYVSLLMTWIVRFH